MTCRKDGLLSMICSEMVEGFCFPAVEGCIYVDGPAEATVSMLSEHLGSSPRYDMRISWKVGMNRQAGNYPDHVMQTHLLCAAIVSYIYMPIDLHASVVSHTVIALCEGNA